MFSTAPLGAVIVAQVLTSYSILSAYMDSGQDITKAKVRASTDLRIRIPLLTAAGVLELPQTPSLS
jgi:hypothetical protein